MEDHFQQQFREESLGQLKKLDPENIVLFDDKDIPPNYTLVIRPNEQTLQVFKKFYAHLQDIEPNHYYYPENDLHLTVIGNIPTSTNLDNLVETISSEIVKRNLIFKLWGLGSNIFCSSVSAYPVDFSLHELRDGIRSKIGTHGDDYSNILESYEYVGWINYLRYLQKPSQEFLNMLFSYKDTNFGEMQPSVIQLYLNTSKVLDSNKAKLIHTFNV